MLKALSLYSGGLDSILAAKMIAEQGIRVEAVYFINAFLPRKLDCAWLKASAAKIGIGLHILDISREHLELIDKPRYGFGGNMNPCIDCRILMFKKAKDFMQEHGFSFLVSGEVLGQRPMSQRRDAMNIIDREAQVKGLVLRPLSAGLLPATIAQIKGWVDGERLFSFSGRSRKRQLELARRMGVEDFLTPAGGCLLTEAEFSRKLKSLLNGGRYDLADIQLLKIGRHFSVKGNVKIIVGRNKEENEYLLTLAGDKDLFLKMRDFAGPLTLLQANGSGFCDTAVKAAAGLTARYSKARKETNLWVDYWQKGADSKLSVRVDPIAEDVLRTMKV